MRLFLALWPDARTRAAISDWQRAWTWPAAAAPVAPERFHVTLHFIGNVARERMPGVIHGLRARFEPFEFSLDCAQVWPNGVAVLQPQRVPHAMAQLHRRLAGALGELELPVESRPFRPHVTIARRARGAVPPAQHDALPWRAREGYALVQSLPGGAGYEIVERFG